MALSDPQTKKIVVIDDDPSHLDVVASRLRSEGFQVVTSLGAEKISPKMASINPDLIITDLVMSGMSGMELIQHLQSEGMGSIPVIILMDRDSDKRAGTEEIVRQEPNVVDIMRKPFHFTLFVLRVHQILKTSPVHDVKPGSGPSEP